MRKDVNILINSKTSQVMLNQRRLGLNYENLQGKIIVTFDDNFVDGIAYLEIERNGEKGYLLMTKENESYTLEIKSSLLNKAGQINMQVRITEQEENLEIPVWKSNIFYLNVEKAINSTSEIPDEYPEWIDTANAKLQEMDNLNIEAEKVGHTTTITITGKDGSENSVDINDGEPGPMGPKGDPGAVKILVVEQLPTEDIQNDALYLVPYAKIEVVELPTTGLPDTIYIVTTTNKRYIYESNQWIEISNDNNYNEYVYINDKWEKLGSIKLHIDLSDYYVKSEVNTLVNAKYTKPISGIPKEDLDNNVKASLEKADVSYSKPISGIPKTDLENSVQVSLGKADSAIQQHQDISGKEDIINKILEITDSSTNIEYPGAQAVRDFVYNNNIYIISSASSNHPLVFSELKKGVYTFPTSENAKFYYKKDNDSSTKNLNNRSVLVFFVIKTIEEIGTPSIETIFGSMIYVDTTSGSSGDLRIQIFAITTSGDIRTYNINYGKLLTSSNQGITGVKTFSSIIRQNDTTAPTLDNEFTNKKYVDDQVSTRTPQYSIMPTASSTYLDQIVQYTGATDSTYTNGHFYLCVSDNQDPANYSWEEISFGGGGSGGSTLPIYVYKPTNTYTSYISWGYNGKIQFADTNDFDLFASILNEAHTNNFDRIIIYNFGTATPYYPDIILCSLRDVNFSSSSGTVMLTLLFSSHNTINTLNYNSSSNNRFVENHKLGVNLTDGVIVSQNYPKTTTLYSDRTFLSTNNTITYVPSGDYNPSTKLYTDQTHYENMSGYDATKTQTLKNVNGVLTWITDGE